MLFDFWCLFGNSEIEIRILKSIKFIILLPISATMDYNLMWDLNTKEKQPGLTWWWWWWIFFIKNHENPERSKQLMILWSTKNCDRIKVNDYDWHRKGGISQKPGMLKFNGMTGIWYYDGKKMHEPFALVPSDYTVKWKGESGLLKPHTENTYIFEGDPENYRVLIEQDDYRFDFKMKPWSKFMSEHRYNSNRYLKNWSYNILKIYGSRLGGSMETPQGGREKVTGTAYFQKVMVNAPAVPWYWGVLHAEDGSYIDYFKPHLGFSMLRRTVKPRSIWDWGELALTRSLQFYIQERDSRLMFKKISITKGFTKDNLPVFRVSARKPGTKLEFTLRSYSRAHWRFEQPWWGRFNSILYYNEYPVVLEKFHFEDKDGRIKRDDLGYVTGNSEHSWGILIG